MHAQACFATPVPPLAVVVGLVADDAQEQLEILGNLVPAVHVGVERPDPGTRDVVRQEVVRDIGPADRVVLGDPGPGDPVKLAGLHGDLDVLPGQGDRDDPELGQEPASRREGEDTLALQVRQRMDGVLGREVAGIPGARRNVLHADVGVLGVPDLVEPVLVEEDGDVERVARRKREVPAEHGDLGRRCHGIVVRLDRVDRPAQHRTEQLARRHQLVSEEQFDLHPLARDLVEHVDRRFDDMLGQGGTGVGLHPPGDLRLGEYGRRNGGGRCDGSGFQKLAPCGHGFTPCRPARRESGASASWRTRGRAATARFPGS